MYRHTHHFILPALAITIIMAAACTGKSSGPESGALLFSFNIESDSGDGTRSGVSSSDDMVSSLELFIFDVGTGGLSKRLNFTSGGDCMVEGLVLNRDYQVYALANCKTEENPDRIADMEHLAIRTGSVEDMSRNGLPMSGVSGPFRHDGTLPSVGITLERAVSKIVITMDTAGLKGKFTATGATIHNAPAKISPFTSGSCAAEGEVTGGDGATPIDIKRFNEGNSIALIVGENMQGTLLEGNSDPWKKVPENIPEKKNRCTYLTVTGEYVNDGLTISDLSFNMFLGEDNTSNFDIRRNRIYNLTLSVSDEGAALKSSWKVERGTTVDTRELSFNRDSVSIEQNDAVTLQVLCSPDRFDYDIFEGEGFSEASLKYSVSSGGLISVRSGTIAAKQATGRIWARSWDRRKSACADITVIRFRPEEHKPVKVHLEPKDTIVRIGDSLELRGYIIYETGDTLLNNEAFDFGVSGNKVLAKYKRNSRTVHAVKPGSGYGRCIFKSKPSMIDSCRITVFE